MNKILHLFIKGVVVVFHDKYLLQKYYVWREFIASEFATFDFDIYIWNNSNHSFLWNKNKNQHICIIVH